MAIEALAPYASQFGVDLRAGTAVARAGKAGPSLALGLGVLYAGLTAVGGYYAGRGSARCSPGCAVRLGDYGRYTRGPPLDRGGGAADVRGDADLETAHQTHC